MKFKDILSKIDFNTAIQDENFIEEMCFYLNIPQEQINRILFKEHHRLTGYYMTRNLCTDTWVGTVVFFLEINGNKEFVGISKQDYRKSEREFAWKDKETQLLVKDYVLSLIEEDEEDFYLLDLNIEADPYYQLNYSSQLLQNVVIYNNQECPVLSKLNGDQLIINYLGEKETVNMKDCYIEYFK